MESGSKQKAELGGSYSESPSDGRMTPQKGDREQVQEILRSLISINGLNHWIVREIPENSSFGAAKEKVKRTKVRNLNQREVLIFDFQLL